MKRMVLALVPLLAIACAHSSVTPVSGPDGDQWLAISCKSNQEQCYERAANECPRGYQVVRENGVASGPAGRQETTGNMENGNVATKYRGSLLVRCNDAGTAR